MALATAKGRLTMVGLNTATPQVFWNGEAVPGVTSIKTMWEEGEQQVKLRVKGTADALYMALVSAGIVVKKENPHGN